MNIFIFLHLIGFGLGFGGVMLVDIVGALWIMRKVKAEQLVWLTGIAQRVIWTAIILQLITGAYLLDPSEMNWAMVIKLIAVAVLVVNGLVLDRIRRKLVLQTKAGISDFWKMPRSFQLQSVTAISVSQAGWWIATIIGFLHTTAS